MTVKLGFEDKAEASRVFVLANLRPSNVLIGAVETILSFLLRSSFKRKRMSARRIQIWFRRQQRLRELWSIAAAQLDENENLVDHLVLHDIKDECEVLYKSTDNSFEEMVDQLDLSELSESLEYSSGSPSPDATDRFAPFPVPLTPSHSIFARERRMAEPKTSQTLACGRVEGKRGRVAPARANTTGLACAEAMNDRNESVACSSGKCSLCCARMCINSIKGPLSTHCYGTKLLDVLLPTFNRLNRNSLTRLENPSVSLRPT